MTDNTPIVVNPNPATDQIATASRDLALVLAALPALLALIGKRDLIGLINYLSSDAGAPLLGVLVTAGVILWRQLHARAKKQELVTVAQAADDSVAIVKGPADGPR